MSIPLLDVTLTTLAYGGAALGRLEDGRAVFVPFGAPGERVRIRLVEEKEHFARGELVQVLEAAPERVTPRCRHFGACGGCHYQHLNYAAQLRAKTDILRDQLARIGHIQNPPVAEAVASANPWTYRNQVQFHLNAQGRLGYVAAEPRREAGGVLAIEECHLPEAAITALWPQMEFAPDSGVERVAMRLGSDGELMLILESGSPEAPELDLEATVSVAHVYEGEVLLQAGEDHVRLRIMEREFRVSPTSFFQVNLEVTERLLEHVLRRIPAKVDTLLDVYCGVGLFSAFLAPRCRRLIGVEASAPACEDFGVNLDEFENVELYEDAAERALPSLGLSPEVVVLDPPRAGLEKGVVDALVKMRAPLLVYVSCDPATLARDAGRLLTAGYKIESVTPFDMFPQTYHIESVSFFTR